MHEEYIETTTMVNVTRKWAKEYGVLAELIDPVLYDDGKMLVYEEPCRPPRIYQDTNEPDFKHKQSDANNEVRR